MPELIIKVRIKSMMMIDLGNPLKNTVSLNTRLMKANINEEIQAALNTKASSCTEVYRKDM